MSSGYVMKFSKFTRHALWGSEDWEISAHRSHPSVIANGPLAGKTLAEVYPEFPLLIKVIDAKLDLSVQVHLSDFTSKLLHGEPKTEMWCMLGDGHIYAGLRPLTTRSDVSAAAASGKFGNLLVNHSVSRGDAYLIPGGMVHAIGAGTRLYEVQQSSDTTFRLYDWDRLDADGKPRELHVKEGLSAINYSLPAPEVMHDVSCQYFDFKQVEVRGSVKFGAEDSFAALFAARGNVTVNGDELSEGQSALVPPGVEFTLSSDSANVFVTRNRHHAV